MAGFGARACRRTPCRLYVLKGRRFKPRPFKTRAAVAGSRIAEKRQFADNIFKYR
jgi:hypothetical protein